MDYDGIKRGDIIYVSQGTVCGSEQSGGRPAVVVSNNMCNRYSSVITVVFLTTRAKKPLPTHVQIRSSGCNSTALCEQVESISKERLRNYVARCTNDEMTEIDKAIAVALGLSLMQDKPELETDDSAESTITILAERDVYKRLYEKMIDALLE